MSDLITRWRKRDGSFRSRELTFGWDNVPMHRWAQAQIFRSLCLVEQDRVQRAGSLPIALSNFRHSSDPRARRAECQGVRLGAD